tara:strand:+ start:17 stop:790 length:774 start_codon:yes stop_codon:yes gene_type:complete
MTTPTLYQFKHPLSNKDLPEQTLANFSDQDIADYKAEFEIYQTQQYDAVRVMSTIIDTCRENIKSIFGSSSECKQLKYFERNISSGATLVDSHSNSIARPSEVKDRVENARKKYCNFIGSNNAPKSNGDDTLQEINNAVAFLMDRGMALNSDFTISNAVSMARASFAQDLNDQLVENTDEYGYIGLKHEMLLANGNPFPTSSFCYSPMSLNQLNIKSVDINLDPKTYCEVVQNLIEEGDFKYEISFAKSMTPHLVIC